MPSPHISPVDLEPPPRPPEHRPSAALLGVPAVCSALLLVLVAAKWRPLTGLDRDIASAVHRWAVDEPGLTQAARVLTDWVWDPWTMRLLCGAVALLLWYRYTARWTAVWLVVTCAVAAAVQQVLKAVVGRARPVWPDPVDSAHYAAFPSGHAMTAAVTFGLLLWLLHRHGVGRTLWVWAVALAALSVGGVGLTRVWLGVHWPTDVLGGWLLGLVVVAVGVRIHGQRHP
ncbi:phosphatase PAP2 family protein [Streptomyces sp. NEAU-W12]|uniref:phosphatase PAP2 family protein n=1 Tax=Streptomyces sp. NEAU-W12 TaxID=2994668 RepID=UPI00224AECAF|nr:phosphatase PAP2 family protein [Streptomyces sp. NEAU-W12]MCX2924739.1 phosphatase PAP2 family protein [Streptomyces sp. NEAU-W12]